MQKHREKNKRYYCLQAVLFLMFSILAGCSRADSGNELSEDTKEPEITNLADENEKGQADTILTLSADEEIRSMWMEKDELYVFMAVKTAAGKSRYQLCLVKDGSLSYETKYRATMDDFNKEELEKADAASYEYEAGLGRNNVVYLLGRDEEGAVRKCYWFSESYFADIPFDELFKDMYYDDMKIDNIEISKSGKIYLAYDSHMCPYDNIFRGVGLGPISGQRFALGNLYVYEFVPGRIYRWDINEEYYPPAEMIECDTLTDEDMPYFIDPGDNIYIAGSYGLSYLPHGGSIWEVLLDTDTEGFDSTAFSLRQIWLNDWDLYLLGQDLETKEWKILKHQLP